MNACLYSLAEVLLLSALSILSRAIIIERWQRNLCVQHHCISAKVHMFGGAMTKL